MLKKITWLKNWFKLFLNRRVVVKGFCKIDNQVEFILEKNSKLVLGKGVQIRKNSVIAVYQNAELLIAGNVFIGHGATIAVKKSLEIGQNSLIAEYVSIRDHDHNYKANNRTLVKNGDIIAPVKIGHNVWLAAKSTVIKGISIGNNAVVGANSVVTKDIAAASIVAGNPAQLIKKGRKA